jgi:hypothetical protein
MRVSLAGYSWIQTFKRVTFRRARSRFWQTECRGLNGTRYERSERRRESAERLSISRGSSAELLEYARLTLQLIERHPHLEEDARIANELMFDIERCIKQLEREASTSRSPVFRSTEPAGNM